jgi:BirA family biotin operon repressor/biotin-[acetyl-CoA-carboxylase] ligase
VLKSSPLPPDLADPLSCDAARLGRFGRQVFFYDTVPSTNDVAATLAEGGAPEGCVVVADAQSAGRGRLGRTWASPAGAGLYVSAVLRPEPDVIPLVTIAAGVALTQGIQAATGLRPDLKWPNDVLIDGRKVAGILAEGTVGHLILGFGINVLPAAYPHDIAGRATSLERELGRTVDRGPLFVECLSSFADRYAELRQGQHATIVDAWRERAAGCLRKRVRWDARDTQMEGIADDIDADGALLVRTPNGLVRVISGEVTWL